ncbi:Heme/steroid binding protein [Phytophthora megakarya]|uniref:Heme/steroid binding protein n=1 Tax=Phytophthora megakarya TaxID=4795 RepID=A0A225WQM3_9STRA|nr:Heme/steroid binding protein [Phytophthora megakarya]
MGNAVGTPPAGPNSLPVSGNKRGSNSKETARQHFTVEQLATFNGADSKRPIYISVKSEVYDVSSSRELYGPSGKYAALAGKDVTRALTLGNLGDAKELSNLDLSDLTPTQFQTLDEWLAKFRDDERKYTNVGRLVDADLRLTLEELLQFNGLDNPRGSVLVGVDGVVYDVTMNGSEFYGPGGMYGDFAGRDASKALACMSLEEEALNNPSIEGLTSEQRKTLDDWVKRFEGKYAIVGKVAGRK